ncbi:MAG: YbhB/YbcL family Raf kinase inhibitor-like protein [Chloroflexi bacterium]|nr:YbhB/YbcL family Raf kinase inhibitor-like protein [Chloroflexota bacterium]
MRSPESTAGVQFALTSPEFPEGGAIPSRYTCDGDDVSPPLEWSGAPESAASLALVIDDPDARGFVHWVVYNIDPSASGGLPAGWSEDAEFQGSNDFGRMGYGGPCPPSGAHRYRFRLLALDTMLDLTGAPTAQRLTDAAAGHVLAEAQLNASYRRAR